MNISKKIEKRLNEQINNELYSSYVYLAMAAYFEEEGFKGCAKWMLAQSKEENGHMQKQYDYVFARGGRVVLEAINKPPVSWKSPVDVFETALKQEQAVTKEIYQIMDLARTEKDYGTENFLQWFISEQVEEEASIQEIVQGLKMAGNDQAAMLMLDKQLGERSE